MRLVACAETPQATDYNVPLITNLEVAEYFIDSIEAMREGNHLEDLSLQVPPARSGQCPALTWHVADFHWLN